MHINDMPRRDISLSMKTRGLSEQEALDLLDKHGPNELNDDTYRTLPKIILTSFSDPTVLILLGIGFIYFFTW